MVLEASAWPIDDLERGPRYSMRRHRERNKAIQDSNSIASDRQVRQIRTLMMSLSWRLLLLAAMVAVCWLLLRISLYGNWLPGFLWREKLDEIVDSWNALLYIARHGALVLAVLIGLGFVLLFLRATRFPSISRYGAWAGIVAATSYILLLYEHHRIPYSRWKDMVAGITLEKKAREFTATAFALGPEIKEPLVFYYLDEKQINALYNQIEPEMVEKERKITAGSTIGGKGEIQSGPISGQLGAEKQTGMTQNLNPPSLSPERKCVEVMKFLVKNRNAKQYSDLIVWRVLRISSISAQVEKELIERAEKIHKQPPSDAEEIAAVNQRLGSSNLNSILKNELVNLNGYMFVRGPFKTEQVSAQGLLFEREFSQPPGGIIFRITAPPPSQPTDLPLGRKAPLAIFGNVIRPLGDDDVIDVRGLAIFSQ